MPLVFWFLLYAVLLNLALNRRGFRPSASAPAPGGAPVSPPNRVLIVGATGGTGRELVTQALARGHAVTALVRNPAALGVTHPQLRIVQGNILDYASVAAAVKGQEAVVSALGHKRFFSPSRILSGGTGHLLLAMEAEGVERFVCETALGIGDSAGRMGLYYTFFVVPVIVPFYFWDKTRQERSIAASRLKWTIVRPVALTNGPARGQYRHGRGIGSFVITRKISRADVADFMLNQLADSTYVRSAPGVG